MSKLGKKKSPTKSDFFSYMELNIKINKQI